MKNTITIIPARGQSKGLKNKNIKIFNKKPLIKWSIDQAQKSKHGKNVYVTSDSDKILDMAQSYGCKTIKRPKNISTDISSSESAIKHALKLIDFANIEYIILLQCTSPLRFSKDIDNAIEQIIKERKNSLFSVVEFDDLTLWKQLKSNIVPSTYNPLNRKIRQKSKSYYFENGSIYIFKPSVLFKKNNRIDNKSFTVYKMKKLQLFEIDDLEDFKLTEKIYNKFFNN